MTPTAAPERVDFDPFKGQKRSEKSKNRRRRGGIDRREKEISEKELRNSTKLFEISKKGSNFAPLFATAGG